MPVRIDHANALAFAVEGMAGTAGSAALRQVAALAGRAPAGRLFAAIATLSEHSRNAQTQLEQGRLAAAIGTMDAMAADAATTTHVEMAVAPTYLKKSR